MLVRKGFFVLMYVYIEQVAPLYNLLKNSYFLLLDVIIATFRHIKFSASKVLANQNIKLY